MTVKEFVQDVKRKISIRRNRKTTHSVEADDDTCSSTDGLSHLDNTSLSSSSMFSMSGTPERGRFASLIRPRSISGVSKKHDQPRHNGKGERKRYRLFSAPSRPSVRGGSSSGHQQSTGSGVHWPHRTVGRAGADEHESQGDYLSVIDIRTDRTVSTAEGHSPWRNCANLESQSPPDRESHSDTSQTLVGFEHKKSDSRIDSVYLHSDIISESVSISPPSPLVQDMSLPAPLTPPLSTTTPSPAPVIPRLTAPTMFLPIPNTDPLIPLLTKHVPPEQRPRRDVVGEYAGRDLHEMVMSNSWRALARMARDRIVASDPEDLGRILDLWSLRLSSLARLRLTNQSSAECTNLFAVLNPVPTSSVPGSFPGSGSVQSTPLPPSPAVSLPLSPSGLSGLAQLPGTPSQKPSSPPGAPGSVSIPATVRAPARAHDLVHPFELTVFRARVHYWSGDPLGYVDALSRILSECKQRAKEEARVIVQRREIRDTANARGGGEGARTSEGADEDGNEDGNEDGDEDGDDDKENEKEERDEVLTTAEANLSMWLERVARVCLIIASQMIEMNDYQAAINLLAPLCTHRPLPDFLPVPSPTLHSALARVYLLSGNLQKAEEHISIAALASRNDTVMNSALLAAASGNWTLAEETLREMIAKDAENFTAINNLAVTLLCKGRIKEGIDLLEAALKMSPSSVVVAEPFLFNLSTLYELRSTAAIDKKRELLVEVAKWSGDGIRTSCLKMPSS